MPSLHRGNPLSESIISAYLPEDVSFMNKVSKLYLLPEEAIRGKPPSKRDRKEGRNTTKEGERDNSAIFLYE
jgi:hypothetical protein